MSATTAARGRIRHPYQPGLEIRAVLFDLDGTLYAQKPIQMRMALELAALPLRKPFAAAGILRALRSYRHAQEELRGREAEAGSLADAQVAIAARRSGLSHETVAALVDEWMIRRPLKYLRSQLAPGTLELLDRLARAGVQVGLLSDYPAVDKLQALGLAGRFSPILCSSDPGINRFKPDPRGFRVAAETWGLPTDQVLMVGDRYEVDFKGAQAAGMPCALVGAPRHVPPAHAAAVFPSLERLARVIDDADD
ncbi:MAG: HAD family hydrolase [Vicinamibacterales bacterium]